MIEPRRNEVRSGPRDKYHVTPSSTSSAQLPQPPLRPHIDLLAVLAHVFRSLELELELDAVPGPRPHRMPTRPRIVNRRPPRPGTARATARRKPVRGRGAQCARTVLTLQLRDASRVGRLAGFEGRMASIEGR